MKKGSFIFIALFLFYLSPMWSQINFQGCVGPIGPVTFVLNPTGTTNDGGTVRNTYQNAPGVACALSAACVMRVRWESANSRWEIRNSSDNGVTFPNLLYINTAASAPNPPDLSLGTWVDALGGGCGGNGSFATWTGSTQSSLLPVELVSFSAETTSRDIDLSWKTASEINNEKFEIEESYNSKVFHKIGEKKGNNTTTEQQKYSFRVNPPQSGIYYYRLKQIDYDGQFEYSKILRVNFKGSNDNIGTLYPSPVSSTLRLKLDQAVQTKTNINLFDMNGHLVYQNTIEANSVQSEMDVSSLANGMYLLQIQNGQDIESHRFIKN